MQCGGAAAVDYDDLVVDAACDGGGGGGGAGAGDGDGNAN